MYSAQNYTFYVADSQSASNWEGWRVGNLRPLFEPVLWFQKPYRTGGTIADNVMKHGVGAWNESAMSKYSSHDDICSNIVRVPASRNDSGLHIAQKPLKLMGLLISLVTLEGQTVLDPFMGSGTTCIAAKITGRHYIGIDIDPSNVNIARKRLNSPRQFELFL